MTVTTADAKTGAGTFPADQLERLAELLRAGGVVFFVGSGFSIDSEGTSARRLLGRVLARLVALGHEVAHVSEVGRSVLHSLKTTFDIEGDVGHPATLVSSDTISGLTSDYFMFNDWATSALDRLLREITPGGDAPDGSLVPAATAAFCATVSTFENHLLAMLGDRVPLPPLPIADLAAFPTHRRGKALFLESVGFDQERKLMAGRTAAPLADVVSDYRQRIFPRHRVLARLAAEGLSPILVTTNFDLLLEGGYRLEGMEVLPNEPAADLPTGRYRAFSVVADAGQFFERGSGQRAALLVKIHGCVDAYRAARNASPAEWEAYLPSVVFTYREIQNWRQDAWSRDLLRTLLRTHTVAFCGYSAADPVIHDTLRTVYEEMSNRAGSRAGTGEDTPQRRAFFFAQAERTDFHISEVLRAAREAGGGSGHEDRNKIDVHFAADRFPTYDDAFQWLYHRTMRELQRDALTDSLAVVAQELLGRPVDARHDLPPIVDALDEVIGRERALAERWGGDGHRPGADRHELLAATSWTEWLQAGLLRERGMADVRRRRQGMLIRLDRYRRAHHYVAAADHLRWVAWAVVVELALRKLIAAAYGAPDAYHALPPEVRAVSGGAAAVEFTLPDSMALRAVIVSLDPTGRREPHRLPGAHARVCRWHLARTVPGLADGQRAPTSRSGRLLWLWAGADDETASRHRASAARLLGVT